MTYRHQTLSHSMIVRHMIVRRMIVRRFMIVLLCAAPLTRAQQALTWDEVRAKFETANPTLQADASGVDELRAQEITAYLRPNPEFTFGVDGTQLVPHNGVWAPLSGTQEQPLVSYLHERDHKRELRLKSAQEATKIGVSQHEDLDRNLVFALRSAFVNTLQAKALLELAKADLEYYDKIIEISKARFDDGDIAKIDFQRIELQRVQYEAELQSAIVNLRTAKIQLLQLLNDRTPVETFDVTGPFDFQPTLQPLNAFHTIAADARPDLRAAFQTLEQSKTNHQLAMANGSTDPTFSGWVTRNPSFANPNDFYTLGLSVQIPLRIFDRNQGEKARTQIDITKSQQLTAATTAQVFSDVDTAYEQVRSSIELLKPYKAKYSDEATEVRDTVSYAYFHGGSTLMDFLNAQSDYRVVQTAYLQLIGSYLVAAAQLNLSVGREVIQ
jgi:cobalt-zinc-cadmium efflux system outer membrane protein